MSRVYVGRLPSRCSERDIERFFRDYGKIREIVLKNGYGFVEFDHHKDAEDAVYDLNGRELRGERVIIEHAKLPPGRDSRGGYGSSYGFRGSRRESRYGPPTRTEYRCIVENLSSRISWQDLKDTMRKAGEVCYADAHRSNRNEGIVEFRSREDLKAAIERFDGYELNGRKLRVFEDRPKRRSTSRSRSRSRSSRSSRGRRSRSRSKSRSRSPRRRSARSGSDKRSKSGSRSPSRNGRSVSRSKSRSHSPVVKRSRSGSAKRSVSRSPARDHSRSKSRSRSASNRSRSASRSPRREASRSRSRSRSRSASAASE